MFLLYCYIIHKNNIYIGELEENLLKRLTYLNHCNNFYLLNIKELKKDDNYSYLLNYNLSILDFNQNNVNIMKLIVKNNENILQLYNQNNNISFDKIYDVAIINDLNNENKNNIYKKLVYNNINIDIINVNDINLYKYKIILNIDNDINNELLNNLISNKNIIINNKISSIKNNYSIDINYDTIPIYTLFTLKNYEQVCNNIYKSLNEVKIKNDTFKNIQIEKNNTIFNEIQKRDNYGFIIVRHVNSEKTNNYWIESYKSIRKYYNNKIIIVDDNSNYEYVKINDDIKIYNCEIVQSKYNSRGIF